MRQTIDDSLKELKLIDKILTYYGYTTNCNLALLIAKMCEKEQNMHSCGTYNFDSICDKANDVVTKLFKEINDNDKKS